VSVLYVVATPIGNLEDISLRALRILREVKLIAAEDTRKTKRLLSAYDIQTPMTSFHTHTGPSKLDNIIERLEFEDVAIVSEAGVPGISDPGYALVTAAIEKGITVVPVPGPSVVTAALAVSGLPIERFTFLGFLPARASARRRLLEAVVDTPATMVIFEAPHRLAASLGDMLAIIGNRRITICRELTKLHEEIFRGTISQALEWFERPRGEFTLVIEGQQHKDRPTLTDDIERHLGEMRRQGLPVKEAISSIASETGLTRRELYQAWLRQSRANIS
jgi:16S rRNA (cytidine1402-2'-O)-methyltransferase